MDSRGHRMRKFFGSYLYPISVYVYILNPLCIWQVGSSSKIYPAANYGRILAERGVPVAEFNLNATPVTELLE